MPHFSVTPKPIILEFDLETHDEHTPLLSRLRFGQCLNCGLLGNTVNCALSLITEEMQDQNGRKNNVCGGIQKSLAKTLFLPICLLCILAQWGKRHKPFKAFCCMSLVYPIIISFLTNLILKKKKQACSKYSYFERQIKALSIIYVSFNKPFKWLQLFWFKYQNKSNPVVASSFFPCVNYKCSPFQNICIFDKKKCLKAQENS